MSFTPVDTVFMALAAVEIIAVGAMLYVGLKLVETAKKGQQTVEPALNEAKAVAELGKAIAEHARKDGEKTARRVKLVFDRVRHRVEHTKRVVKELKPGGQETALALRTAHEKGQQVARTARSLGGLAQSLGRVGSAARAAADAAREGQ